MEFIAIANLLAIEIDGTRQAIASRILTALTDLSSFANSIKIATDSETDEPGPPPATVSSNENINAEFTRKHEPSFTRAVISFTDFEHIISPFRLLHTENVINWVARFENLAQSFALTVVHKFIFVERG